MKLHNLGTVIVFEIRRTLTRVSFWLTSLSVPALMLVIFGLMWFSNVSSAATVDAQRNERVAFTYTDASGIVVPRIAEEMGGTPAPDAAAAAQAVRDGSAQLHLDIPADPTTQPVRVVGADLGLVRSDQWQQVAQDLLERSASDRIGDSALTGVLGGVPTTVELWKDGHQSPGFAAALGPGFFVVLLYMAVLMLGQQMLNITVEEKENRVTEMILTTLDPRVLIIGKVVAVLLVGLVQAAVLVVPILALAFLSPGLLQGAASAGAPPTDVPTVSFSGLEVVIDPVRIALAAGLFAAGFLLFTGLLVAIGAVMPTAKDAGSAFGAVILGMFVPLYAAALVITDPTSPLSQFLTWFPLTSPITALVRNALGVLPVWQALGVMVMLFVCAFALLWLGVRLFRQGSISYDKRLSIAKALRSS